MILVTQGVDIVREQNYLLAAPMSRGFDDVLHDRECWNPSFQLREEAQPADWEGKKLGREEMGVSREEWGCANAGQTYLKRPTAPTNPATEKRARWRI